MATTSNRPRMALSVPEELSKALADLADATGRPASTLAVEFLLELAPQMHDMARIVRLAKSGKADAAKRAAQHMLGNAYVEFALEHQPDMFTSKAKGKKAKK